MKHRSTNPLLALAIIAALLLGACSSGGDDDNADKTTTTASESGGDDTPTTEGGDDGGDETTTTEDEGGDGGGSVDVGADGQAYVEAMMSTFEEDEDLPMSAEDAECFSSRFVETIGVDRLQDAGITPEDMAGDDDSLEYTELNLSEDEGNELYEHFGDCGIDLHGLMMQSLGTDEDVTPEMRECMEGVLTEENLRAFMVISMTEGEDAMENNPEASEFMSGLLGCAFMGMDTEGFDSIGESVSGD